MNRKYTRVLRQFPLYLEASEELCRRHGSGSSLLPALTAQVTAPVLFTYVRNVLLQAERMGLRRLYFLSRDGYVMRQIAQEIAHVCPVSVELRYLCCSAIALRLPCCHRLEYEEAAKLLLRPSGRMTARHLMNRAYLTREERLAVYDELGFPESEEELLLSGKDYDALCARLTRSVSFQRFVRSHADAAFDAAYGYLRQEGLSDGTPFGIVDAGWNTQVQRDLKRLSDDIPPITGFYFGLDEEPLTGDGGCSAWYFSAGDISLRSRFSQGLFACMCAAPHGMTLRYREKEGSFAPILRDHPTDGAFAEAIETQLSVCREFAEICAPRLSYTAFDTQDMHRLTKGLLIALMYRPTEREAQAYTIPFRLDDYAWSYGADASSGLPLRSLRRIVLRRRDAAEHLVNRFRK